MRTIEVLALLSGGVIVGCGGAKASVGGGASAAASAPAASVVDTRPADIEIREANAAMVKGARVEFDGEAEGLSWPALQKALGRAPEDHAPVVIEAARNVPIESVMRAVWTERQSDVTVRTSDASGKAESIVLKAKPSAPAAGCHLAVLVQGDGSLNVAAPGGIRVIPGPDANEGLAKSLASEKTKCPIRYVGFGAQARGTPWGTVFDVAAAVDRDKSAGDARYVLAEPVQVAKK